MPKAGSIQEHHGAGNHGCCCRSHGGRAKAAEILEALKKSAG
jgi:hypothetical protein